MTTPPDRTAWRTLPAADLPPGTVITTPDGRLTKTDRPTRCPWRIGGTRSLRYVANWRAQEWINAGAPVTMDATTRRTP